jgi:hypothetical protein
MKSTWMYFLVLVTKSFFPLVGAAWWLALGRGPMLSSRRKGGLLFWGSEERLGGQNAGIILFLVLATTSARSFVQSGDA